MSLTLQQSTERSSRNETVRIEISALLSELHCFHQPILEQRDRVIVRRKLHEKFRSAGIISYNAVFVVHCSHTETQPSSGSHEKRRDLKRHWQLAVVCPRVPQVPSATRPYLLRVGLLKLPRLPAASTTASCNEANASINIHYIRGLAPNRRSSISEARYRSVAIKRQPREQSADTPVYVSVRGAFTAQSNARDTSSRNR